MVPGSQMKYLKSTTWLLLLYWIPLMNLGPSLHHADFFGLHSSCCVSTCCGSHGHSHESDHDHDHDHASASCCQKPSSKDDRIQSSRLDSATGTDGECQFCNFFEKYNVVFSSFQFTVPSVPANHFFVQSDVFPSRDVIVATARGPPAFLLWA